jgi:hypothetical protein
VVIVYQPGQARGTQPFLAAVFVRKGYGALFGFGVEAAMADEVK